MRLDVLNIIKSARDITNAIILTHNIDFLFIQSIVIPALRKCGSPALTIFADADCAAQTYQYQARVLSDLGLRYRVVPVAMKTGFRFHPKAILLSGTSGGILVVGSGNLTFGGWRENGEIWISYETQIDGTAAFSGFRDYVREVIDLCVDPKESIKREIEEAFDPDTRKWAVDLEPAGRILGRAGRGESMLEQMKAILSGRGAERLFVCAPYFDEDGEALKAAARELAPNSSTVLVQSNRTNLLADVADHLGPGFTLKAARFEHREQIGSDGTERIREALLHAKFYAVQLENEVLVFVGSANCSRAGLTIPGASGNAELMTYTSLPLEEFEETFVNELVVEDVKPILATVYEKDVVPSEESFVYIRAARMEADQIRVTFQAGDHTTIVQALVDERPIEIVASGDRWITLRTTQQQPRLIVLIGDCSGKEIRSLPHWIDNEYALRVSARGRSLAESISGMVRGTAWGIGAWTEVLSELYKHLQYMPKGGPLSRVGSRRHDDDKEEGPTEFQWADVFAQGYGLPVGSAFMHFPIGLEERIGGLRSMLLRWYGIAQTGPDENVGLGDDEVPPDESSSTNEGDQANRPITLTKLLARPEPAPASPNERKRALKLVQQVAKRLAHRKFLSDRPAELLAADLKVAGLLLRAGLRDGWLKDEDFFDATLEIWLPLFFSAESNDDTGWLEQRYLTGTNEEDFAKGIRSVELAAALACWALSTPDRATSPQHACFVLASVLSVARLPWLWQTGGNEEIAKQVAEVFAYTSHEDELDWNETEKRWLRLIRRGYALDRLQNAIGQVKLIDLSKKIKQPKVLAGELLWQGRYGFCVAEADCYRADQQKVQVRILRRGKEKRVFAGPNLIPVAGLLDEDVVSEASLSNNARRELASMVDELRVALRPA